MTAPKFLAVDFFCGAGGTTRGLLNAGGLVLAGIDNDRACEKTYESNNRVNADYPKFLRLDLFKKSRAYPEGQQHVVIDELTKRIRKARKEFPGILLLFSICAPCQPFTRLSKKGITKERYQKQIRDRSLLLQCLALVKNFRPHLIFCENVAAITSSAYGEVWTRFEKSLHRLSYSTGSDVVDAAKYGIPQNRKRSILIGVRQRRQPGNKRSARATKSLVVPAENKSAKPMTVRQAISGLPNVKAGEFHPSIPNHATQNLSKTNKQRLACAKPGQTNKYLEGTRFGDLSLECHKKVNKKLKMRCFNDVYTRMHPDKPSPTITTRCLSVSNGRFGHYDQRKLRGISMREAAMLQSFPKGYIFYPKDQLGPAARMIGNAVPPKLARFFAKHLLSVASPKT